MKPRSAVATFIVQQALASISAEAVHKHAERFKINPPPLKRKEKARVDRILDFYRGKIAEFLSTLEFEGDFAEVPGFPIQPKVGSSDAADALTAGSAGTAGHAAPDDVTDQDYFTSAQTKGDDAPDADDEISDDAAHAILGAIFGGVEQPSNMVVNIGKIVINR